MKLVASIGSKNLNHVFLNGVAACEVAKKADSANKLEASDLNLDPKSAKLVLDLLRKEVNAKSVNHPLFFNFSDLPIQNSSQCSDGKKQLTPHSRESCFVIDKADDYRTSVPSANWNKDVYDHLTVWLGRQEMYRPETRLILSDADDTLWARGINYTIAETGVRMGLIPKETIDKSSQLYNDGLYEEYTANVPKIYAGLTLKQIFEIFEEAQRTSKYFPRPYQEMKTLVNHSRGRGMPVGVVSASPLFVVTSMLEAGGFNVPLWAVEGIDIYMQPPEKKDPSDFVKLTKLVHGDPTIKTWKDVLAKYGNYKITNRGTNLIRSREGKGAAAAMIRSRWVKLWNGSHKEEPITEAQVETAAIFGDNFAPFAKGGNDEGLLRMNPFAPHAILLNIFRAKGRGEELLLEGKGLTRHHNFQELVGSLRTSHPTLISLEQVAQREEGRFSPKQVPQDL